MLYSLPEEINVEARQTWVYALVLSLAKKLFVYFTSPSVPQFFYLQVGIILKLQFLIHSIDGKIILGNIFKMFSTRPGT